MWTSHAKKETHFRTRQNKLLADDFPARCFENDFQRDLYGKSGEAAFVALEMQTW